MDLKLGQLVMYQIAGGGRQLGRITKVNNPWFSLINWQNKIVDLHASWIVEVLAEEYSSPEKLAILDGWYQQAISVYQKRCLFKTETKALLFFETVEEPVGLTIEDLEQEGLDQKIVIPFFGKLETLKDVALEGIKGQLQTLYAKNSQIRKQHAQDVKKQKQEEVARKKEEKRLAEEKVRQEFNLKAESGQWKVNLEGEEIGISRHAYLRLLERFPKIKVEKMIEEIPKILSQAVEIFRPEFTLEYEMKAHQSSARFFISQKRKILWVISEDLTTVITVYQATEKWWTRARFNEIKARKKSKTLEVA